jgi:hypothetical protein
MPLERLPLTPTLLITDAGFSASSTIQQGPGQQQQQKKKKEPVGLASSVLIPAIMETVRAEGHVLLPCESAGRALELMQLLGSHWVAKNLGMYNLVFLSPMAFNIMEFCRSQLEWMSDSLSRAFYNGKPNPFELPLMRVCTSVKEMERLCYPGPKVVIATDSSFVCGCAKELLLKWGGDPRFDFSYVYLCTVNYIIVISAHVRTDVASYSRIRRTRDLLLTNCARRCLPSLRPSPSHCVLSSRERNWRRIGLRLVNLITRSRVLVIYLRVVCVCVCVCSFTVAS